LGNYKPTEEEITWIQTIAQFYHELVPLMRTVLEAKIDWSQDSKETREMVALSVLVSHRHLNPEGKLQFRYADPKTCRKTSVTTGERLSGIFVPFSGNIRIYNHDEKDYAMDKFQHQPFETSDSSFLEPLSILWKKYSVHFPSEQAEAR
jgi:hypothetical protein